MTHPTGPSGPLFVHSAQLRAYGNQLWQTAEQTSAGLNQVYSALAAPAAANPMWPGCNAIGGALDACDCLLTHLATTLSELSRSVVIAADAYDEADEHATRRDPRGRAAW